MQALTPRRPNVLMIVADDMGARLGTYGSDAHTPNLDRLARQSVTFDRAYAQFPWCGPSRASFLTGMRPDATGVMNLTTLFRTRLPDIVTLPQYFRAHGYFSGRVGKIFHQGVPGDIGRDGLDDPRSWDQVVNPRGRDKDGESGRIRSLTPGIGLGSAMAYLADEGDDREQTDGKVADEAIAMMTAHRDAPFFIGVGFYRPHVPEVAPKKYFDLNPIAPIRPAAETPATLARVLPASRDWLPDDFGMTVDQQRQMIQAYRAATSFMDAQVGRVLAAVDRLGLADDTIVVFLGDHGYLLGEHGQWMKNVLWEEADRVPLIIRVPGTRNAGRRSPRTVELLDLYPTLTGLAGLPRYGRNQGTSLQPLLKRPASARWMKPALSQVQGGRSVRTQRWRYTEWEGGKLGRELYDQDADPLSHRNLADDPRQTAVVRRLRSMLPPGPVERRPPAVRYDRVRQCLDRANATSVQGTAARKAKGGGEGGTGLKICDTLDP